MKNANYPDEKKNEQELDILTHDEHSLTILCTIDKFLNISPRGKKIIHSFGPY